MLFSKAHSEPQALVPAPVARQSVLQLFKALAPQDWAVIAYLLILNLALIGAKGEGVVKSALQMAGMLGVVLAIIVSVRLQLLTHGLWAPFAYRLSMQGVVQFSYFLLGTYLPLVNPRCLDKALYSFDLRFFGFETSVWADAHITAFTSEWFAFFYFCYFFLLLAHSVPIVLFAREERLLSEFCLGMIIMFGVGKTLYALVPGFGPVRALATIFRNQYPHGLWLDSVMRAVATGGAQKDIFPSLHTAAPTFLTLFSFRNRHLVPFRYTWGVVGFFAANIIVATMFLRWHWVVDVAAGLTLAGSSWWLAVVLTKYELERRASCNLGPSWPPFARRSSRA